MIWRGGRVVDDRRIALPADDRLVEHGIGLFETLRTWGGEPALLPRHLARLRRSAVELGVPIDPADLPDRSGVAELLRSVGLVDGVIRISATGGGADRPSEVFMTARPLPPEPRATGYSVVECPWTVAVDDPLLRHKTTNYWSRALAHQKAQLAGFDESYTHSADGRIWEGSRTSIFWVESGRLLTPPASGPIVAGIMREVVLEVAEGLDLDPLEADLTPDRVAAASEVFVTNSVRGIIPVASWKGRGGVTTWDDFSTAVRLRESCLRRIATGEVP